MPSKPSRLAPLALAAITAVLSLILAVAIGGTSQASQQSSGTASGVITTVPRSTTQTSTAPPACSTGSALQYQRVWYCPGFIAGVKRTSYGLISKIVLRGVNVIGVGGTTVTVMGGPSCVQDPTKPPVYCGATIPQLTVSFAGLSAIPKYGDVINLFGVTGSASLRPTGHVVIGFYDPMYG